MRKIKAKTSSEISGKKLQDIVDLDAVWVFTSEDFDPIIIDINYMKEHLIEDDKEDPKLFIVPARKVAGILTEAFGDKWRKLDLLYLYPQ